MDWINTFFLLLASYGIIPNTKDANGNLIVSQEDINWITPIVNKYVAQYYVDKPNIPLDQYLSEHENEMLNDLYNSARPPTPEEMAKFELDFQAFLDTKLTMRYKQGLDLNKFVNEWKQKYTVPVGANVFIAEHFDDIMDELHALEQQYDIDHPEMAFIVPSAPIPSNARPLIPKGFSFTVLLITIGMGLLKRIT